MFNPSRDEARRFFIDVWNKIQARGPLAGLEQTAAGVIIDHPEYHRTLSDPEHAIDRDYVPEHGEVNPFLHLSLHLAIEEQLSIDQPPGIRAAFERLTRESGSPHDARHAILECLAETIWQAQRTGAPPDAADYLRCIARR
jgi:hypothetical protein